VANPGHEQKFKKDLQDKIITVYGS